MNRLTSLLVSSVLISLPATPSLAQNAKLEQARAKAEEQITKGRPEEAVKTASKFAEQNPSATVSRA